MVGAEGVGIVRRDAARAAAASEFVRLCPQEESDVAHECSRVGSSLAVAGACVYTCTLISRAGTSTRTDNPKPIQTKLLSVEVRAVVVRVARVLGRFLRL